MRCNASAFTLVKVCAVSGRLGISFAQFTPVQAAIVPNVVACVAL